jgi:hypothetical protein
MIAHVTDWADSSGAVRSRRPLSSLVSWKVLTPAMLSARGKFEARWGYVPGCTSPDSYA